jgi:hypothetical protein
LDWIDLAGALQWLGVDLGVACYSGGGFVVAGVVGYAPADVIGWMPFD